VSLRLFVAVVPPPAVVAAWDALLQPRRDAEPGFRWTLPEGWHLTCAFLAAVPEATVADLQEALSGVGERTAPFAVVVDGAGAFPDPDRAQALWLGVSEGADPLAALARRCRNAAAGCDIAVEGGRFRPHLTIARTRPAPVTRWLRILDGFPPQAWTVDRVSLISSRSLPGGSGYRTLSEHPLVG
jgi:2'-5' RNA ligase